MNVFVFVNCVSEIGSRQTTALLIAAVVRAGHNVHVADVGSLSLTVSGSCKTVVTKALRVAADVLTSDAVAEFVSGETAASSIEVNPGDSILIRTNPGRDKKRATQHAAFLDICRVAETLGVKVINSPGYLEFFASKASLLQIDPVYIPASLLSSCVDKIAAFIRDRPSENGCVLKPTSGSRGEGVIRLNGAVDLEAKIAEALTGGAVIVQEFVSQDVPGDKRVVVFDGKILKLGGHPAGIERRPATNDFRANLHAGGTAYPLTLSPSEEEAATVAAGILNDKGIRLAGVDLIGARIIEFNVFSTGGLFDCERFTQQSFVDAIVSELFKTF